MAEKIIADNTVHALTLGTSFGKNSNNAFHSIRYDFKPASVDATKMSRVEVGKNHSVTVTVPHIEGAVTRETVYQGNKRAASKECILIFNHKTGDFQLEKLSEHLQLKKTRTENKKAAFKSVEKEPAHTRDSGVSKTPTKDADLNLSDESSDDDGPCTHTQLGDRLSESSQDSDSPTVAVNQLVAEDLNLSDSDSD